MHNLKHSELCYKPSSSLLECSMFCHAAYQFASVGVTPCALNISQAIGTSLSVTFTVFDNGVPPLSATVTRTLLITAPCPTGQYYCSAICQQISCASSAALAAAAVTPVITLTSIPTAVFGSSFGGSASIPYGTVPAFSLTPCTSYSKIPRFIVTVTSPHASSHACTISTES